MEVISHGKHQEFGWVALWPHNCYKGLIFCLRRARGRCKSEVIELKSTSWPRTWSQVVSMPCCSQRHHGCCDQSVQSPQKREVLVTIEERGTRPVAGSAKQSTEKLRWAQVKPVTVVIVLQNLCLDSSCLGLFSMTFSPMLPQILYSQQVLF